MALRLLLHEATSFFSRPVRRKQSAFANPACALGGRKLASLPAIP